MSCSHASAIFPLTPKPLTPCTLLFLFGTGRVEVNHVKSLFVCQGRYLLPHFQCKMTPSSVAWLNEDLIVSLNQYPPAHTCSLTKHVHTYIHHISLHVYTCLLTGRASPSPSIFTVVQWAVSSYQKGVEYR